MKKINVIVVGLLCLSLLTGCTTHKIERSQQYIEQEKVEKNKKEIASESKKRKQVQPIQSQRIQTKAHNQKAHKQKAHKQKAHKQKAQKKPIQQHQQQSQTGTQIVAPMIVVLPKLTDYRKNIKMIRTKRIPALTIPRHLSKDTHFHVHRHGGGSAFQMVIM